VRGALGRRVQAGIELIGRDPEVTRLRAAVAELIVERRGRSVVVVGKAGIGKSRMLEELRTIAVRRGIMVFEAAGDAVEVDAPYNAIRPFVAALLSRPALAAGPASASMTASASIS